MRIIRGIDVSREARIIRIMMTTRRKPRSLPLIVRARQLRLAGLAETNRLKHEVTMLMVVR